MPTADVVLPSRGRPELVRAIQSLNADPDRAKLSLVLILDGLRHHEATKYLHRQDRVVMREGREGVSAALNAGLDVCQSEVVFRFDDDDVWLAGRFRSQLSDLENAVASAGRVQFQSLDGRNLPALRDVNAPGLPLSLLLGNYIVHPAVAIRREVIAEHRYRNVVAEDYDLWLRSLRSITWKQSSLPVIRYSVHKRSESRKLARGAGAWDVHHDHWSQLCRDVGITPDLSVAEFRDMVIGATQTTQSFNRILQFGVSVTNSGLLPAGFVMRHMAQLGAKSPLLALRYLRAGGSSGEISRVLLAAMARGIS